MNSQDNDVMTAGHNIRTHYTTNVFSHVNTFSEKAFKKLKITEPGNG